MIRVALVEKHRLIREGIRSILHESGDIEVVAEVNDGNELIGVIRDVAPAVVLLDADIPGLAGLAIIQKALRTDPMLKVIMLDSDPNNAFASRYIGAGIAGYMLKSASAEELHGAIRDVARNQRVICPEVAQKVALRKIDPSVQDSPFERLTDRELQVVTLLARGHTPEEVATQLFLGIKTIHSHRYRIFNKLGVQNDVEVALLASRYGFLDLGGDAKR